MGGIFNKQQQHRYQAICVTHVIEDSSESFESDQSENLLPHRQWSYLDGEEWVDLDKENCQKIERQRAHKYDGLVYHCFGDGLTASVDFETMETYCNSAKCSLKHNKPYGPRADHLTFKLRRGD